MRSYALLFLLGVIGSTPLVRKSALRILKGTASVFSGILQMLAMAGLLIVCTGYLADGSFSPFLYFRF